MKFLTAVGFLCLASYSLASVLAPYGAVGYGPLGLGGVAHYAAVPAAKGVAYSASINHAVVGGLGLAPYGLRYGLGLAAPVAGIKYGVAAAPVAPVAAFKYGVPVAPIAPVAAVKYGVAATPLAVAPTYGLGFGKGFVL